MIAYLVIDLTTGAIDGFYFREELARESLASLRADYPRGSRLGAIWRPEMAK